MTKLPDSKVGMLEVTDVWPKTDSAFFGYQVEALDAENCTQPNNVDQLAPACGQYFPWILESAEHVHGILAGAGITKIVNGTIGGNDPVPAGAISHPLEIREKVLYLGEFK